MTDELGPAVAALQRKLEEQIQSVADTKRTINMLMKMSGQDPMFPDSDAERSGAVRADQFYGKGLTKSAAEYLAMRQQACQADEIYRGLKAGGFDFETQGWQGDDRDMVRNLAMSLSKNTGAATGKFHRLKNGSFGLRAWYDEDFLKKVKKGEEETASPRKVNNKKKKAAKKSAKPATPTPPKDKGAGKPTAGAAKVAADKSKPKSSAKERSRPAADQTTQKAAS